jgi:hypothetical protein
MPTLRAAHHAADLLAEAFGVAAGARHRQHDDRPPHGGGLRLATSPARRPE